MTFDLAARLITVVSAAIFEWVLIRACLKLPAADAASDRYRQFTESNDPQGES